MRIDQPDEDGGRADDAYTSDANKVRYAESAACSADADRVRAMPAASVEERKAYYARMDAVFRAYEIDQAYLMAISRRTVPSRARGIGPSKRHYWWSRA